ncbi:MAG TPA: class I SAM-dependent methyltransferase [Pyrinomonadaceae bacterium]|nr:class I SAM-dependent methyltransferase [Pyrinomonadaceae bacterium]
MSHPIFARVIGKARRTLGLEEFTNLRRWVVELDDVGELKKVFGWEHDPVLDDPTIHEFASIEDVNGRRVRDAECIGAVVRNSNPSVCLEIGTAQGHTTALMAVNAPQARVYTVNIPPEEIEAGEGGELVTAAFSREEIGRYYRERGLTNVEQILANTARWEPEVGTIDVAFVDGCHDTEFVYNDTRKILAHTRAGSFVLWHDFHPGLVEKKGWIRDVCLGVEKLYSTGLLTGPLFHVRNSWLGIYRVGGVD